MKTIQQFVFLKSKNSIIEISTTNAPNKCEIVKFQGIKERACVEYASWVVNYFAIIVLVVNTKFYKVIISKDVISQEQLYALRLYLRSSNH